jgi:hypothetical protein
VRIRFGKPSRLGLEDNTIAFGSIAPNRAGISPQPARSALPTFSAATQPVQNARKAAVQKMAASGRRLIST